MTFKNRLGLVFISALIISLSGCSSEEETVVSQKTEIFTLNANTLKIAVGKNDEIKINKGNGDYKAFSLNPQIADVKIENGKILVEGKSNGNTSILISDKDNQFKKIAITSFYESITVESDLLEVTMPIGFPTGYSKTKTLNIVSGNDGYKVSTGNNDLFDVSINKKTISIICKKEGSGSLKITDGLGIEKIINIKIQTSEIPYDKSELNMIKENNTIRYIFGDRTITSSWYTYYNDKVNELNHYGYKYSTSQLFHIYFAGDKAIGIKDNGKLSYKYSSTTFTDQPIKFEIIKNDGTKIWAVYSFLKDGKLYFGHFCQNINPPAKG